MSYSTVSFRMTLSDLAWLSEIFSDMKHRAVSLRQLSFFFVTLSFFKRIARAVGPILTLALTTCFRPKTVILGG